MNENNTPQRESELQTLKAELTKELSTIAVHNPETDDWELSPDSTLVEVADSNEHADLSEDTAERIAILAELETRYRNVVRALEKISAGTYGICEISGEPIEAERLDANPAARTNIAHRDQEADLPI